MSTESAEEPQKRVNFKMTLKNCKSVGRMQSNNYRGRRKASVFDRGSAHAQSPCAAATHQTPHQTPHQRLSFSTKNWHTFSYKHPSFVIASEEDIRMVQHHLSERSSRISKETTVTEQARISPLFFLLFRLTTMLVVGFGNIIVNITFLPAKLITFHSNSVTTYSFILSFGALVAGNPLTGAFLDRHRQKRRLCLAGGTLLFICAFLLIVQSSFVLVLAIGVILAQLASAGIVYSALATMLLQIPLSQRALASAVMGVSPLIGGVIRQLVSIQLLHANVQSTASVFIGVILVIVFPFLLCCESMLPERTSEGHAVPLPMILLRDLLHAFRSNDFSWTGVARCLIFLGSTTTLNYSPLFLGAQQQLFFAVSVVGIVLLSSRCPFREGKKKQR